VSSGVLWAALHGIWDSCSEPTFGGETRLAWQDLLEFNDDYARRITMVAGASAPGRVFVHDHQFAPLSPWLRAAFPNALICVAIHSAWPSADQWRVLPRYMRAEMVRDLLDADLVVVLARRWARNFVDCAAQLLDARATAAEPARSGYVVEFAGRRTRVAVLPLGYNPAALATAQFPNEHAAWVGERPLVVHDARTDPVKNAPRAIQAFGLAAGNDCRLGGARLLVQATPHHLSHAANQRYLEQLEHEAKQANDELGDDAVRVVLANDAPATLGAYARADVLVANSVLDGQSRGPFEAAMLNDRGLQVVLSENCGAAEVLGEHALLVNPFDVAEQAEAICRALMTPAAERAVSAARLRASAAPFTWEFWATEVAKLLA
jgi:trehalose 6-phosphate synthase